MGADHAKDCTYDWRPSDEQSDDPSKEPMNPEPMFYARNSCRDLKESEAQIENERDRERERLHIPPLLKGLQPAMSRRPTAPLLYGRLDRVVSL